MSDRHQISPFKINTLLCSQVRRIKKIIDAGDVNVIHHKYKRVKPELLPLLWGLKDLLLFLTGKTRTWNRNKKQ